jgi:hypothetical protein
MSEEQKTPLDKFRKLYPELSKVMRLITKKSRKEILELCRKGEKQNG